MNTSSPSESLALHRGTVTVTLAVPCNPSFYDRGSHEFVRVPGPAAPAGGLRINLLVMQPGAAGRARDSVPVVPSIPWPSCIPRPTGRPRPRRTVAGQGWEGRRRGGGVAPPPLRVRATRRARGMTLTPPAALARLSGNFRARPLSPSHRVDFRVKVNKRQRLRLRQLLGIFKASLRFAATGAARHDPSIFLSFKFFRSAGGGPVTVTQVRTGPAVRPGGARASPLSFSAASAAGPGPGPGAPSPAASRLTLSGQWPHAAAGTQGPAVHSVTGTE